MNTKHLQYLIEIQKCGSINKAAKKCFITQSHLSRILQTIEKEIGFDIFTRDGTAIEVTPGGSLFFESIQKIVSDCQAINNIPSFIEPNNSLSIASSPSPFLTQCYFEFCNAYPTNDARDVYREAGLRQLMELISTRNARFGYFVMSMHSYEKYKKLAEPYNLNLQPIRTNLIFHVVMHKHHPLAEKAFLSVRDLTPYPFVADVDVDFEDTLKWLKLNEHHRILSVSSRGTVADALRLGRYFTVQIKADDHELAISELIQRPISDLASYMMICLIEPNHIELSEREKRFIAYSNDRINSFFSMNIECKP